jgi:hypothetical protein
VREAFGITKPSTSDLTVIIGFGVVVFISMEIVKAILRKKMVVGRKMLSA